MPMIDIYAAAGTFADPRELATDLATAVMTIEQVPDIPMFRKNTAAFVHELPADCLSNVDGDGGYVRVQVLTNSGALDRDKQLSVVRRSPTSSPRRPPTRVWPTAPGCCSPKHPTGAGACRPRQRQRRPGHRRPRADGRAEERVRGVAGASAFHLTRTVQVGRGRNRCPFGIKRSFDRTSTGACLRPGTRVLGSGAAVPSGYGRISGRQVARAADHLPARAEELADRHRPGHRRARRRAGGPRLGAAGRAVHRGAAHPVHRLRHPARPLGRPERGRTTAPAHRAGVHHDVGRGRADPADRGGRARPADRLSGPHAGQRGVAGGHHHGVEDLHPLRGRVGFGGRPRPHLRAARCFSATCSSRCWAGPG